MTLTIGRRIRDIKTGEERFKLLSLLARGERFDIALAEDTHLDGKQVCVKAIRYDNPSDLQEVQARRADLEAELEALTLPSHLLPEPLDWLHIENTRDFKKDNPLSQAEPLLIYELQAGKTLSELIEGSPEGLDPQRALGFIRELALLAQTVHAGGYLLRDCAPEHVIVGLDDILHVVGCGNMTRLGALPGPTRLLADRPCVAPELRAPTSADVLRPAADIYSLGALLLWALTGREPLKVPECPLDAMAFHRLGQLDPGLGQLIARMIHVNPSKRFATIDALLPHLSPTRTPDPAHPDFHDVTLPSPWRLDEQPKPAHTSLPTPGPLVTREAPAASPAAQSAPKATPKAAPKPAPAPANAAAANADPNQTLPPTTLPIPAPAQPTSQPPATIPSRRTDLAVRGIIGGTFLLIFTIIMAALKLKGYF